MAPSKKPIQSTANAVHSDDEDYTFRMLAHSMGALTLVASPTSQRVASFVLCRSELRWAAMSTREKKMRRQKIRDFLDYSALKTPRKHQYQPLRQSPLRFVDRAPHENCPNPKKREWDGDGAISWAKKRCLEDFEADDNRVEKYRHLSEKDKKDPAKKAARKAARRLSSVQRVNLWFAS